MDINARGKTPIKIHKVKHKVGREMVVVGDFTPLSRRRTDQVLAFEIENNWDKVLGYFILLAFDPFFGNGKLKPSKV